MNVMFNSYLLLHLDNYDYYNTLNVNRNNIIFHFGIHLNYLFPTISNCKKW